MAQSCRAGFPFSKTNPNLKMKTHILKYQLPIKTSLLAAAIALSGALSSPAAVIADYQFTGGSAASTDTQPNSTAANFTLSSLFSGNGGISAGTETAFANSSVTPSTAGDAILQNSWFSFTVTPDSGYSLSLTSLTFNTSYDGIDGAAAVSANWFVRSSLDGFSSNIGTTFNQAYTTTLSLQPRTVDLTASLFQDVTSPVTFRIYIYDGSVSSGKYVRVNDVVLNGNVSVVPEPTTCGLAIFAGLVATLGARKRRQKSSFLA